MRTGNLSCRIISLLCLLVVTQSGCASLAFQGNHATLGFIFADTHVNQRVTANKVGSKQGEACAMSVLGWVTVGDASAAAAAKSANITAVASVDNHYMNVLGIYSRYCSVVTGE